MQLSSFLITASGSEPQRTSFHSHLQSTAYHYNSILHAKAQIDNIKPNQKTYLNNFKNKHNNKVNAQRIHENKKLLKTIMNIQRNYSLYGVKDEQQEKDRIKSNASLALKNKFNELDLKKKSPQKIKSLKNPFIDKMQTLKISKQNTKLLQKISNAQPLVSNKKQLKQWNTKLKSYSNILDSNRSKQQANAFKNNFFLTFAKMRTTNRAENNSIRLQAASLLMNPQFSNINIKKENDSLRFSKRLSTEPINLINQQKKQNVKLKTKKLKNRLSKRLSTMGIENRKQSQKVKQNISLNLSLEK